MTFGPFTYAFVDDAKWLWAIVTNYKGSQEYDDILFAFDEDNLPTRRQVEIIIEALKEEICKKSK